MILCLLDAEDSGKSGSTFNAYEGFCIGTEYLANHWPEGVGKPAEGVLLDMVGRNDTPNPRLPLRWGSPASLSFPIESYSMNANASLVNAIWTKAAQRSHPAFINSVGSEVIDDHLPLNNAGIKCIDIIQMAPPEWHTIDDTPEYCSAAALNQSGDTLLHYLYD